MRDRQKQLRSKDMARILDCSPDEVVNLVHKGKLKATKEGKVWKYHPVSVSAYRRRTKLSE